LTFFTKLVSLAKYPRVFIFNESRMVFMENNNSMSNVNLESFNDLLQTSLDKDDQGDIAKMLKNLNIPVDELDEKKISIDTFDQLRLHSPKALRKLYQKLTSFGDEIHDTRTAVHDVLGDAKQSKSLLNDNKFIELIYKILKKNDKNHKVEKIIRGIEQDNYSAEQKILILQKLLKDRFNKALEGNKKAQTLFEVMKEKISFNVSETALKEIKVRTVLNTGLLTGEKQNGVLIRSSVHGDVKNILLFSNKYPQVIEDLEHLFDKSFIKNNDQVFDKQLKKIWKGVEQKIVEKAMKDFVPKSMRNLNLGRLLQDSEFVNIALKLASRKVNYWNDIDKEKELLKNADPQTRKRLEQEIKEKQSANDRLRLSMAKERKQSEKQLQIKYILNNYRFIKNGDDLYGGLLKYDEEKGGLADELIDLIFNNKSNHKAELWQKLVEKYIGKKLSFLKNKGVKTEKLQVLVENMPDRQKLLLVLHKWSNGLNKNLDYIVRQSKKKNNLKNKEKEIVTQINTEIDGLDQMRNKASTTDLEHIQKIFKNDPMDMGAIWGMFDRLKEKGYLEELSHQEFKDRYEGKTDGFAVTHGGKIFLDQAHPVFKAFIYHTQELSKKNPDLSKINLKRGVNPHLDWFADEMVHEVEHLKQFFGDHEKVKAVINRLKKDNPQKYQKFFNKSQKLLFQKGRSVKEEDVISELMAVNAESKYEKLDPYNNELWEKKGPLGKLVQEYKQLIDPKNNKLDPNLMAVPATVMGAIRDGQDEDYDDDKKTNTAIGGGDYDENDEESVVAAKTLTEKEQGVPDLTASGSSVLEGIDNILNNFDKFNQRAAIFDDKSFVENSGNFRDDLEKLRKYIETIKDSDDPKDKAVRQDAADYIKNLNDELDTISGENGELSGYNQNPGESYLKGLWRNTVFLSTNDIYQIGATIYEWGDRRYKRKQDDKIGKVGEQLFNKTPFTQTLAQDFVNKYTSAEDEEVNKFTSAMKDWGIDAVIDALKNPKGNVDYMKAAFTDLVERGQLEEWLTDKDVWRALSGFSGLPVYSKKSAQESMDAIWGKTTASVWASSDISNMKSKADSAKPIGTAEGDNLSKIYQGWIEDLLRYKETKNLADKPSFTEMLGVFQEDLRKGLIASATSIPLVQEIILLEGLPDHAVNELIADLQNNAPVFGLFSIGKAKKLGLDKFYESNPQTMRDFMAGKIALPLKWNPAKLEEDKFSEDVCWVTVHDFQASKSKGNRTARDLADYDQTQMDYIFPGASRKNITELLTPSTDGSININDKKLAGGVVGLIKTMIAYFNADDCPPARRKLMIKNNIIKLMQIIEFSKRSSLRQWGNDFCGESEIHNNNYNDHVKPVGKSSLSSKHFNIPSDSRWGNSVVLEQGVPFWSEQLQTAFENATGIHKSELDLGGMIMDIDASHSPLDMYADVMRAVDRLGQ